MENSQYRVLVVDDEDDILEFVRYNLEKEGYRIETASNGKEAIRLAKQSKPHLILLDIMMPEMDGVEVCRELRADREFDATLIAFLTARSEDYSQIAGFDVGGDDYITKPIRPRVLTGRVAALLRRTPNAAESPAPENGSVIAVKDLRIDREKMLVLRGDETIALAKKEFELLWLLASKPGKVFGREEIFKIVWGEEVIVGNRTIDVHIRKLREKVGEQYISTFKGIGYKFEA
jgi:two-component system alkaline phosphatase synthesis response regulator PhoP